MNPGMDAIYLLSPQPHIVDCLLADLDRGTYKNAFLVWTSVLDPQLRRRIDSSPNAQQMIAGFETLHVDYFPRESHLVTFRDPWSFPVLYHPACNNMVREHMQILAQKVRFLPSLPPRSVSMLILRTDYRSMRTPRRVSPCPILQTKEPPARGECSMLTSGPVCPGGA